jgi:uncharacterized membrane protein YqiK
MNTTLGELQLGTPIAYTIGAIIAGLVILIFLPRLLGVVYIPHTMIGVIEKIWSRHGSLREGRIIARQGEAGFQTRLLRGGLHFGLYPWQYKVHKTPLVVIGEGKMGYVYARDGQPLEPDQTLGRNVPCNHFQDAESFLAQGGQRGRQRGLLREGVYALNLTLFVVITEEAVYSGPVREPHEQYHSWQEELKEVDGFSPIVIGSHQTHVVQNWEDRSHRGAASEAGKAKPGGVELSDAEKDHDTIGVVSIQDGPTISSSEIIAPEVKAVAGQKDHNYFQDPEAFLALGGKRGKQLQVLTDGTFFINRWFGTVEIRNKTLIPIGYVGTVVSYYGQTGTDTTGDKFRYGEQVDEGQRGVWKRALTAGKYALNPYAVKVELVPTINFVLRWVNNQSESHKYDENLTSIDLITKDGYEPRLPLSLVLHIDYQKAPSVVQRFGDVKRLITQTLDPILTAYFRDVAQEVTMLDLLSRREELQRNATEQLSHRFAAFDINVVSVLIGRPESKELPPGKADPIDTLFDQLRMRRLADEQKETFAKQEEAARNQIALNKARAQAERQADLTTSAVQIEIASNRGKASLAEAEGDARKSITLAEGNAKAKELEGKGEASRLAQMGLAEALVTMQTIAAYRDPRLYALQLVSEKFANSRQPLVPQRLFMAGGNNGETKDGSKSGISLMDTLIALILSEKTGLNLTESGPTVADLKKMMADFSVGPVTVENGSTNAAPRHPATTSSPVS